jgi:hypothetical protein
LPSFIPLKALVTKGCEIGHIGCSTDDRLGTPEAGSIPRKAAFDRLYNLTSLQHQVEERFVSGNISPAKINGKSHC